MYSKKWFPRPPRPQIRNFAGLSWIFQWEFRLSSDLFRPVCPPTFPDCLSAPLRAWIRNSVQIEDKTETSRIPITNLRKSRKFRILGLGRVGGFIFIVNFKKRVAEKLRRIILLHLGLITCRFHFGKNRTPLIFMVLEPSGCVHDLQNQLFF